MKDEIKWQLWIKDSYLLSVNPLKPRVTAWLVGILVFLTVVLRCAFGG